MPILPTARAGYWTPSTYTGVPGGIPTRSNLINLVTEYDADPTGNTDLGPIVNEAYGDAAAEDVLYLPNGDYLWETGITFSYLKKISFRGESMDGVRLLYTAGGGVKVGSDATLGSYDSVGGCTRGDTSIEIDGGTGDFSVGTIIYVTFSHDDTLPSFSVVGFGLNKTSYIRKQHNRVVSKTSTHLTLETPLLYTADALYIHRVLMADGIGVENMTLEGEGSASANKLLYFQNAQRCWAKNVRVRNTQGYHLAMEGAFQCTIEGCWTELVNELGSNRAGLLLNDSTSNLIVASIFRENFPVIEVNNGASNNVVAYNFCIDANGGQGLNTNHGPHNGYNLYECNVFPNVLSDGYFGSESELTLHRNYVLGQGFNVSLKRFTRNTSLICNILSGASEFGTPNLGNGSWEGEAELSNGDPWNIWNCEVELTTRTSDTVGVFTLPGAVELIDVPNNGQSGNRPEAMLRWGANFENQIFIDIGLDQTGSSTVGFARNINDGANILPTVGTMMQFFEGKSGYQELDLDVENTTIQRGNYRTDTETTDPLDGETEEDSFAFSSRPSFQPEPYPFPAFDPSSPPIDQNLATLAQYLPAAKTYLDSIDEGGGSITCTTLNVTTLTLG